MIRDLPVLLYTAICLAALFGFSNGASAQLGGPKFINYGVGEGLSQSTVLSMYQDHYGFIWLGTRDGLNRFDGYGFEVFRRQPSDSTALANNVINDITGDSLGNIWIATQGGVRGRLFRSGQPAFSALYPPAGTGIQPQLQCSQCLCTSSKWAILYSHRKRRLKPVRPQSPAVPATAGPIRA